MSTATLDQTLDLAMRLPPEQQEMLLEILKRRQSERNRREIAQDAQTSIADLRAGYLVAQRADEVISELHRSLDEP